jgi:hypothetical protein
MQEYLAAWDHIARSKKRAWQIAALGRNVEAAFRAGDKVIRLAVSFNGAAHPPTVFYYTPVTRALRRDGELLNSYVHAQRVSPTNHFWQSFRTC